MTGVTVDELQGWVEFNGPIHVDIVNMNIRRVLCRGFMNGLLSRHVIGGQSDVNLMWVKHYTHAYWVEQGIAIRRQTDANSKNPHLSVVSLRRLFDEIEQNPGLVSADWFATVAGGDPLGTSNSYKRIFGCGKQTLDLAQWRAMRCDFVARSEGVRKRVNKTLAHADEATIQDNAPASELFAASLFDVHNAIESLSLAFVHAHLLLCGSDLSEVTPTIIGDYREPFRSPIFAPSDGEYHDETEDVAY